MLRDGLPEVVETDARLAAAVRDLAGGTGPVAIDAERASGYRYSARAYLIQLRREGSTTWLVDPTAFDDLTPLQEVLSGDEWILHAASQDLPCLRGRGRAGTSRRRCSTPSWPPGFSATPASASPRSSSSCAGCACARSTRPVADWSRKSLPTSWLEYAALDVEVLVEIREELARELVESGKDAWAQQEFAHAMAQRPVPGDFTLVSYLRHAQGPGLDAPSPPYVKVLADPVRAAGASGTRHRTDHPRLGDRGGGFRAAHERSALLGLKGFHGRGAERYNVIGPWIDAIVAAR